MTDTQGLRRTLAAYNENGELYVVVGLVTGVAAYSVPILSLVAIVCGHRLLTGDNFRLVHRLVGALIGGLGVIALLRLLWMMATVL